MKPANDPGVDYKALVEQGYDRCAAAYDRARREDAGRALAPLIERLPDGASVLDIGCGAGVPVARELARRFVVTGVDISAKMVARARTNVPQGTFIHGDVMSIELPESDFDAAVAFYSIFHLPRQEHEQLFRRIHRWLAPGGLMMATLSHFSEDSYTEADFFGATMYWSNFGLEDYREILQQVGFDLLEITTVDHGFRETHGAPAECHALVLVQKRAAGQ